MTSYVLIFHTPSKMPISRQTKKGGTRKEKKKEDQERLLQSGPIRSSQIKINFQKLLQKDTITRQDVLFFFFLGLVSYHEGTGRFDHNDKLQYILCVLKRIAS